MDTTMNQPTQQVLRLTRMQLVYVAILALFLSALTIFASGPTLQEMSSRLGADSPFASAEIQLTVLRVAAGVWAVLFSVLQALILAVLLAVVAKVPRPGLGVSWLWVLVGQVPFLVTVAVVGVAAGAPGVALLTNVWLRVGFGVLGVLVYAAFARASLRVSPARLGIFVGIAVALNAALMLIAR